MAKFVINGGERLGGEVRVRGSKNAALPLLTASLLTSESVHLSNIPQIRDVNKIIEIFESLGVKADRNDNEVVITAREIDTSKILSKEVGELRGSILLMGALLGRLGAVTIPLPGGDIIGARPIDVHLDAFKQMGAIVNESPGEVTIDGSKIKAGDVIMREFSVTATENVMMLAATTVGTTRIEIAAAEPHVVAVGRLLNRMGAKVSGAGTHTIIIEGKSTLKGCKFRNIPDMLEAGLFMLLGAATKSHLLITSVPVDSLNLFYKKLEDMGLNFHVDAKSSSVEVRPSELKGFAMQSLPYPGIPTDLQAPFAVVATQARGTSLIHDPMYEDRLKHILELQKMGAKAIICDPHRVIVHGPTALTGKSITSPDIRAGATLVMAGLIAEGQTIINKAEIIERGYEDLAGRLRKIGANIKRENEVS